MARATYIYLAYREGCEEVLACFTVKRQGKQWLALRCPDGWLERRLDNPSTKDERKRDTFGDRV